MKHAKYSDLNSKQKEIYNFQKVASLMADYGFNCIKLADDWQGADFLAYHYDGVTTKRVQLKGRMTIDKKYVDENLHMTFPIKGKWFLIAHDELVDLHSQHSNWLETDSWTLKGSYSSATPNREMLKAMTPFLLTPIS